MSRDGRPAAPASSRWGRRPTSPSAARTSGSARSRSRAPFALSRRPSRGTNGKRACAIAGATASAVETALQDPRKTGSRTRLQGLGPRHAARRRRELVRRAERSSAGSTGRPEGRRLPSAVRGGVGVRRACGHDDRLSLGREARSQLRQFRRPGAGPRRQGRRPRQWSTRRRPWRRFRRTRSACYDMHGNIFEWMEDCYEADRAHTPTDGSANKEGDCAIRVFRNGTFMTNPYMQRRRGAARRTRRRAAAATTWVPSGEDVGLSRTRDAEQSEASLADLRKKLPSFRAADGARLSCNHGRPAMANAVVHFEIFASKVERARTFYERAFGWQFEAAGPPDFYSVVTGPDTDPGLTHGLLAKRSGPAAQGPINGFRCTIERELDQRQHGRRRSCGRQVAAWTVVGISGSGQGRRDRRHRGQHRLHPAVRAGASAGREVADPS